MATLLTRGLAIRRFGAGRARLVTDKHRAVFIFQMQPCFYGCRGCVEVQLIRNLIQTLRICASKYVAKYPAHGDMTERDDAAVSIEYCLGRRRTENRDAGNTERRRQVQGPRVDADEEIGRTEQIHKMLRRATRLVEGESVRVQPAQATQLGGHARDHEGRRHKTPSQ